MDVNNEFFEKYYDKKYLAEAIGTAVLVLMGCGTAVSLGCTPVDAASVVGTAMAFGLAVIAMAYTIGGVSGCHINPAITLAAWMSGRISDKDAVMYVAYQFLGAFVGSFILFLCVETADIRGTGANVCQPGIELVGGLFAEIFFTTVFVLVVLAVTDSKKGIGNYAGLVIGLTLVLVHLVCIRYTGTSVNPARSFGPAIFEGFDAIKELWIFFFGPAAGGALAAVIWKYFNGSPKTPNTPPSFTSIDGEK